MCIGDVGEIFECVYVVLCDVVVVGVYVVEFLLCDGMVVFGGIL